MAQEINSVTFELLVKAHNGDRGKAEMAWRRICALGGYGDIPSNYRGGLDVKGLMHDSNSQQIHMDALKRIQDYFAGDNPYTKTRVFLNNSNTKSGDKE